LALPFRLLQGKDIVMHPETGQSVICVKKKKKKKKKKNKA
jgi:hypothetical protein